MNGGYVPVNLTAFTRPNFPDPIPVAAVRSLDGYVRELALHDDQPDAMGILTANLGPFRARSWATFQQTYTSGSKHLTRGGGIVVAKHFMADL